MSTSHGYVLSYALRGGECLPKSDEIIRARRGSGGGSGGVLIVSLASCPVDVYRSLATRGGRAGV